jgi:hypothetical protein
MDGTPAAASVAAVSSDPAGLSSTDNVLFGITMNLVGTALRTFLLERFTSLQAP